MQSPFIYALIFCVSGASMIALVLELGRDDACYMREGEVRDGQYVMFDEPEQVCESSGSGSGYRGRSLRSSSSSNSSGSWFRK